MWEIIYYDDIHTDWCIAQGMAEEEHIKFKEDILKIADAEKNLAKIFL